MYSSFCLNNVLTDLGIQLGLAIKALERRGPGVCECCGASLERL
jgi:hypothetical protein